MKKAVVYSCSPPVYGPTGGILFNGYSQPITWLLFSSGLQVKLSLVSGFFHKLGDRLQNFNKHTSDTSEMMSRTGLSTAGGLTAKGEETLNDGEAGEENSMLVDDEYGDGVGDILNIGDPESSKFLGGDGVNS